MVRSLGVSVMAVRNAPFGYGPVAEFPPILVGIDALRLSERGAERDRSAFDGLQVRAGVGIHGARRKLKSDVDERGGRGLLQVPLSAFENLNFLADAGNLALHFEDVLEFAFSAQEFAEGTTGDVQVVNARLHVKILFGHVLAD